tara:strand:- start:92 stop:643 length:552 start_codon:yes stop_codon:yes gene_type:complete
MQSLAYIFAVTFLLFSNVAMVAIDKSELNEMILELQTQLISLQISIGDLITDRDSQKTIKGDGLGLSTQMTLLGQIAQANTLRIKAQEAASRGDNFVQLGRQGEPERGVNGHPDKFMADAMMWREQLNVAVGREEFSESTMGRMADTIETTKKMYDGMLSDLQVLQYQLLGIEVTSGNGESSK